MFGKYGATGNSHPRFVRHFASWIFLSVEKLAEKQIDFFGNHIDDMKGAIDKAL